MKREMAVLGSPTLIVFINGLCGRKATFEGRFISVQELCEKRDGRPGLPVPNSPYKWSLWT